MYRVCLKSLKHLFSRYLQSPWEHRKNITARLKLRFWSLYVGMWKKSIRVYNYVVASKWKNRPISPFSTIIFLQVHFGEHSQRVTLNALPPTVPRLPITGGALPQPQLNQFPAAPFRFCQQLSPITHFTQKGQKGRIFLFWCHDLIFWPN
jgi:hypothetical protein